MEGLKGFIPDSYGELNTVVKVKQIIRFIDLMN